jgi:hypothetical protein
VVHAEMLEAVPVEFHSSQSCQQFSLVKWREVAGWLIRGFSCQLKVNLWREG